ncbi:MAG: aminomethyltransferase beta-barrel domain-containing protein [Planctomycetota bacterium]
MKSLQKKPISLSRKNTRSLSHLKECTITKADENNFTIEFTEPQFGPTPGQHAVLYDERDYIVAGGVIL